MWAVSICDTDVGGVLVITLPCRQPTRMGRMRSACQPWAVCTQLTSTLCSRSMKTQEQHAVSRGNQILSPTPIQVKEISDMSVLCSEELWPSGWLNKPDPFALCLQGVTRRFVEKTHEPSWWRRTLGWQSALSKLCLGSCMKYTAHRLALLSDTSALEPSSGSSTLLMQSCWRMCWGTMLCPGNRTGDYIYH